QGEGTWPINANGACKAPGWGLKAAKMNKTEASGRFQVADKPMPWISEPNGVSIRYVHGKPLGLLLAAIRPEQSTNRLSPFLKPIVVGLGTTITSQQTGTLYFKVNDSPGELADNSGQVDVKITAN